MTALNNPKSPDVADQAAEALEPSTVTDNSTRPSDELSPEKLKDLLWQMMLIRRFEERCMQAYQTAKIGGFCHIYIGQEAVAVGSIGALNQQDPIIGAYRDHGLALAKGMDPNACMAEMFGKTTGCAKGKGGSMHMFDKKNAMYGGHAIVGGQCPMGLGLAWSAQYLNKDEVTLCYLGDGALNQGGFLEAMNMAAVYNLPIIFVLENNSYSMGTHITRGTAMGNNLRHKAEAFGLRYAECDGLDVLDTYDTFSREVANTRNARPINYNEETGKREELPTYSEKGRDQGPAFINVKTYRYQGHSMSDPQKYRTKDEVGQFKDRDCVDRFEAVLIERDVMSLDDIKAMDTKAKDIASESIKHAEAAPMPTREGDLFEDVYINPPADGPWKVGKPNPDFA